PKSDKGEFLIQVELPKDASLELTNQYALRAENYLSSKPEVEQLITTVGQSSGDMGSSQATAYKAEINVKLVPREARPGTNTDYLAKTYSRELTNELVGANVKTVNISIMGTAENANIQLVVMGSELDSAMYYAEAAKAILNTIPGAAETKLSVEKGTPEINVQVDRDKIDRKSTRLNS